MSELRPDLAIIAAHVAPDARVLDVGCGDGALLAALRDVDTDKLRKWADYYFAPGDVRTFVEAVLSVR